MSFGFKFWPAILSCGFLLAPVPSAADIATPTCEAYLAWASGYDKKDRWQLNSANRKLNVPAVYESPKVEALFGKPALAWSQADVKAASKLAKSCSRQARKEKRGKDSLVFRNIQSALNYGLSGVLGRIERAEKELDTNWRALLAVPASKHSLQAFGALRQLGAGGALDPAYWQVLAQNINTADYKSARGVVAALREMPDEATESLRPEINERYEALRGPVVNALQQELAASPGTLEGLKALEAAMSTTREELGPALTDADYAALDETRRQEIESVLLDEQIAAIDAATETLDGLATIKKILSGAAVEALTEPNAAVLQKAALERRETIGTTLVDAEIGKLSEIPGTLDGLHQLLSVEAQVLGMLDENKTGLSLTPFKHAVVDRFATLGKAAYSDYEDALDAFPENEQGLKDFRAFVARNKSVIQRIRRSTREKYELASVERLQTIEAAVEREHARLAALPLPGAVFAQSRGPRFEFRDDSRVYMVMSKEVTVEGEYEEDGDRLIIRTPQGNMVMNRDGIWLKGYGMELKRQSQP